MKLYYIEWQDACANGNWFTKDNADCWHEDEEKWIVRQCGWLIKEDKKGITLAGRWQPENDNTQAQYGQLQYIPKTWIIKRKLLK